MFTDLFDVSHPLIGMVHLPPLPDAPNWVGNLNNLNEKISTDINALVKGGAHGLLFENYGDSPFTKNSVSALTISFMTRIISDCIVDIDIPFGVNVLRNDWEAALSIATATGGSFIRVNILSGVYATDQGIIEGSAYDCLKFRNFLEKELGRRIFILADVNTKHGRPIYNINLKGATLDLVERVGPDGLIITGPRTGMAPNIDDLKEVKNISSDIPVLVGSGVNPNNITNFLDFANGFIVGSYLKTDGNIKNAIDQSRLEKILKKLS
jgi:membrane complex biogenesis BtpA family protein